jgi:hypothetical protein
MKTRFVATALFGALMIPAAAQAKAPAPATPAGAPANTGQATAADIVAGTKVFDSQGVEIGQIEAVQGDNVVIAAGANRATLAKSAFAKAAAGVSVNATKAQLDAAVADASAKAGASLDTALVANAEVKSQDGAVVGTVKQVQGDQVILDRPDGAVSLTRQFFAADASGLTLRMTAAQLDAAAKAAQPAGS